MKLGCFCSISNGLPAAVREAKECGANTLMLYTGSPQSPQRKNISELYVPQGHELMLKSNITDLIVHAPFYINIASPDSTTYAKSVMHLLTEVERTKALGSKLLVLHPGCYTHGSMEQGLKSIITALNIVYTQNKSDVVICIETMAGKGTELGCFFQQLYVLYNCIKDKARFGVCLDTCHIWDAGYDIVSDLDKVIATYQSYLPIDTIKVIHLNDSKNPLGSHKDRHENIGKGYIGFDTLYKIANHPLFESVPKILETPNGQFKEEISLLRNS